MEDLDTKSLLKLLAPFLAMTIVVTLFMVMVFLRFAPGGGASAPPVVTFDVLKYTNAQRAIASAFVKKDPNKVESANEVLLNLSARTRTAIEETAGPGVLVVLKQAVVQGQRYDITDKVLVKLGLPTDVPTSDAAEYSLDQSPTLFSAPIKGRTWGVPAAIEGKVLP
jgi:hypothetical protein